MAAAHFIASPLENGHGMQRRLPNSMLWAQGQRSEHLTEIDNRIVPQGFGITAAKLGVTPSSDWLEKQTITHLRSGTATPPQS